jgi:hypothetical protein
MSADISHQDLKDAIARIAGTHDGENLYLWLQKQLMALPVVPITDGGLREFNGRRMLVAELIAMMSEGIKLSGRADDTRPIVFRLAGSERTDSRPRFSGAGRRVNANTPVPGYDADPDAPDTAPGSV